MHTARSDHLKGLGGYELQLVCLGVDYDQVGGYIPVQMKKGRGDPSVDLPGELELSIDYLIYVHLGGSPVGAEGDLLRVRGELDVLDPLIWLGEF